ncbi:TadE/TadG family type IV pilus assembly protein [Devosia sp. A16]|uniref:TadE/TadG family type IV pilus assembly protein n=1 Tax=Devosia sp. A16 TaxID=1736675 RepID=UPI0006D84F63|nr:TadE/TadG family type IV pilus assembly protein [Devosia sp. A16]
MLRRLQQFRADVRAVAAVEFALVLPLLIGLYLGSIEAASLYSTDHKVATVASTMADLVSRERGEITSATLTTYFDAARTIMLPYAATGLVQTVSLLQIDSNGVAKVKWSKASGAPKGRDADSLYPLDKTTKINELARGSGGWLVVSEITYPYQPIFGLVLTGTITLKHVQYYLPRFPNEIKFK